MIRSATMTAIAAQMLAQNPLAPRSLGGTLKPLAIGGGRNNQAAWHYPVLPPAPLLAPEFLSSRANTATWNIFNQPFV